MMYFTYIDNAVALLTLATLVFCFAHNPAYFIAIRGDPGVWWFVSAGMFAVVVSLTDFLCGSQLPPAIALVSGSVSWLFMVLTAAGAFVSILGGAKLTRRHWATVAIALIIASFPLAEYVLTAVRGVWL